jgi:hypothetical protein
MRRILTLLALLVSNAHAAPPSQRQDFAARAIITRWLAAQNQGDFAAYQALYAPGFTGVKRVGGVARPMGREAWLADRRGMFRAPMSVTASIDRITSDGTRLVVELEQTWKQGAFADTGRKRILLDAAAARSHGARPAILFEEMLDSRVLLGELACLRLLYPGAPASGKRVDADLDADTVDKIEVLDLGGTHFLCRVDTRSGSDVTVSLALAVRGKRWRLASKEEHLLDLTEDRDNAAGSQGEVSVTPMPLRPGETALLVEVSESEYGPMHDVGKQRSSLRRVSDAGLTELIAFESTWSNGEADRENRCQLESGRTGKQGYPDLIVVCVEKRGDWHDPDPSQRGIKEKTRKRRHRWDGARYAPRS